MENKTDRFGNEIGGFQARYEVFETPEFPQVYTSVSESMSTESVYVRYTNSENNKTIVVRYSNHINNAVLFGDQLDGFKVTLPEILYHLGLKKRVFQPVRLRIKFCPVSKKDLNNYDEADLTIQEMYDLGEGADLSGYYKKIAKGSNYLILGNTIEAEGRYVFVNL